MLFLFFKALILCNFHRIWNSHSFISGRTRWVRQICHVSNGKGSTALDLLRNISAELPSQNDSSASESELHLRSNKFAVMNVIEDALHNVMTFIPQNIFLLCESEIKTAISILVLAVIKRSSEQSIENNLNMETILHAADSNNDGNLTLLEWFDWISETQSNYTTFMYEKKQNHNSGIADFQLGEMTSSLVRDVKYVSSVSVSSLKVTSRISVEPQLLISAFIAGGISSGYIDASFYTPLLRRLSEKSR